MTDRQETARDPLIEKRDQFLHLLLKRVSHRSKTYRMARDFCTDCVYAIDNYTFARVSADRASAENAELKHQVATLQENIRLHRVALGKVLGNHQAGRVITDLLREKAVAKTPKTVPSKAGGPFPDEDFPF